MPDRPGSSQLTRLEDHMRITAIIAPEASTSLTMLRNGCMGKRTAK